MKILSKKFTEDELAKLEWDLNVARAKVYRDWRFNSAEIATLLDIPESQVRAMLGENETHEKPVAVVYSINHDTREVLVGYLDGSQEWVSIDKRLIWDTKREN